MIRPDSLRVGVEAARHGAPKDPVFIVGMPRSGTTLVSNILSRHSQVYISPETHFVAHDWRINNKLDLAVRANRDKVIDGFIRGDWFDTLKIDHEELRSRFRDDDQCTFPAIFHFILQVQSQRLGKPITGEKTPGHYEHVHTLLQWFPDARVIFMMRDPRAVSASTIDTPFGSRFINFHARRWTRANEVLKSHHGDRRVYLLRYEDLVGEPNRKVKDLCDFVGIEFEPGMLAASGKRAVACRDAWRTDHHARADMKIDARSVEKWKERLRPGQVRSVEYLCFEGMREHNYPLITKRFSHLDATKAAVAAFYSRLVMGALRHAKHWVK